VERKGSPSHVADSAHGRKRKEGGKKEGALLVFPRIEEERREHN